MDVMLWFIFIIISVNKSLQECITDIETSWEFKLQKYLQKKPDIYAIPCDHDGVEAKVRFVLKWFTYDSVEGLFTMYSWIHLEWEHRKLTWDPADYGGLNNTIMSSMHFWQPELKIINSANEDYEYYTYSMSEPCEISSNGRVICIFKIVDSVICASDLTKWPYDTQSCSVKLGVNKHQNKTVRFRSYGRVVSMIGAEYGAEWDIIDYQQVESPGAEVKLEMTFVMERHAESLAAMLIYPSIALTALSIASFTLDVRRQIRLGLVCFSLANHFNFFMELQEHIPGHSVYPPTILFYYRVSMLINIFLVLLTYILNVMCKTQKAPQNWICTVNDSVFKSRGKVLVWPKWDSEIDTNEFVGQWTNFANIINNVLFIVVIIVYVCIYFVYIPQPLPLNY